MNRPNQPGVAQTLSWDEKKTISIETIACLKSIIEAGHPKELWPELLQTALETLKFRVETRVYEIETEYYNQAQANAAQQ